MMKTAFIAALLAVAALPATSAELADTLEVYNPQVPLLIGNNDNVLMYAKITAEGGERIDNVTLQFDTAATDMSQIASVTLYYSGVEAHHRAGKNFFKPLTESYIDGKGDAVGAFSVKLDCKDKLGGTLVLDANQSLSAGDNYFWVSVKLADDASLTARVAARVDGAEVDGRQAVVVDRTLNPAPRRTAVAVRRAGDNGVAAYRIPGLVTTDKGTLLAVYDVRYNNSTDLQQQIDVGLSRSTDGGRTWSDMIIPLSFAGVGGLPDAQNGVGDPCILYDGVNDVAWIAALWCHGMGNKMAWFGSQPGIDIGVTGQLVLTRSGDDGVTWSQPYNVTRMVKDPEWHLLLQGPGRGITMRDGTLVFPIQYIAADRIPCAGIMYSRDKGETWRITNAARSNTTESQVAELPDGSLMLNMRDNRKGSRAVSVTGDLGETWTEHSSSRSALREPVCMASLISVPGGENVTGKNLMLFSNPDTEKERRNITIKLSTDDGTTWPAGQSVLLDEDLGWGYSCLTMVDASHVGILYESSVANMTFQVVPLADLMGK